MKLKMLAAVCAMVVTNAFAGPSMTAVNDETWKFSGDEVQIGTNTDHYVFNTLEAGKYFATFAGSSTGNVSFSIDSVMLNGSVLTVQPDSDDYSGKKGFHFTLDNVSLDGSSELDVTYTALNKNKHPEGKAFGSYDGTVSITPAVPEPETYALLAAGLGAICFVARRRRAE